MNLQHSRIAERCEALKLQRMAAEWPAVAAEAAKKDASFADFLERLLETETCSLRWWRSVTSAGRWC